MEIPLPRTPESWDYRFEPPCLDYFFKKKKKISCIKTQFLQYLTGVKCTLPWFHVDSQICTVGDTLITSPQTQYPVAPRLDFASAVVCTWLVYADTHLVLGAGLRTVSRSLQGGWLSCGGVQGVHPACWLSSCPWPFHSPL